MKKTSCFIGLMLSIFLFVVWIGESRAAESAAVLPKGVFKASLSPSFYFPIKERFNSDGKAESVDTDFNASLGSNVFSDLALVEAFFGMPAGSANIGKSVVSFEYEIRELVFQMQYGVTDKLTFGVNVPYAWLKTNVKETRLDTTDATVGKNTALSTLAPLAVPGTVLLNTEDAQALIGPGLQIGDTFIPGMGFQRLQGWSGEGFEDIQVGGRYQYLKTNDWRLAFSGGVKLPTGKVDDPDNLVDLGFGTGAYTLLFRLNNDYIGIKNLVLNATLKYDLTLPDKQTKRVPGRVHQVLTGNKEKVSRNLGDVFTLDTSATYSFSTGWSASLNYLYSAKSKDHVSGTQGFNYSSLEEQTDWAYHDVIVGIAYSTVPLFKEKKFAVPMTFSLNYENVFAGKNNFLKQDLFTAEVGVFF